MATKKKASKATKKSAKKEKVAVGYNTIAALEGSVGAPPLAKTLKAATGKDVRSVVLRVDLDFAMKVRTLSKQQGRTITSITRDIAAEMK